MLEHLFVFAEHDRSLSVIQNIGDIAGSCVTASRNVDATHAVEPQADQIPFVAVVAEKADLFAVADIEPVQQIRLETLHVGAPVEIADRREILSVGFDPVDRALGVGRDRVTHEMIE